MPQVQKHIIYLVNPCLSIGPFSTQIKKNQHFLLSFRGISLLADTFQTFQKSAQGIFREPTQFFRAGLVNATVPLDLSTYLLKEKDYVPWATALEHFQHWSTSLAEASPYRLFESYVKKLLTPISNHIGWEDTGSHLIKLMRQVKYFAYRGSPISLQLQNCIFYIFSGICY